MKGTTMEMLIFILGFFHNRQDIDENMICDCLGINRKTLFQRLGELRGRKLLIKYKHKYICMNHLTEAGIVEFVELIKEVENLEIRPEVHGVHKIFKLKAILPLITDPAMVIRVVRIVARNEKRDIIDLLRRAIPPHVFSRDLALFKELTQQDGEIPRSLDQYIRALTMVGSDPAKSVDSSLDVVSATVTEAEHLRRQSKIFESFILYRNVLETSGILPGCWICSVVGLIQCTKAIKSPEEAINLCDTLVRDHVMASSHKACIMKAKADILSDMYRCKEADPIYQKALRIARAEKLPSLQGMIMNNIGVNYFRWKRKDEAKKAWYSARNHCKAYHLHWTKTLCEINLADIESQSGNILKAKDLLMEAHKFMTKIGDHEGVSEVDFNLALVFIVEGEKDQAIHYFRNCEEFPMMYETKLQERRKVMRERFVEKGWDWQNL